MLQPCCLHSDHLPMLWALVFGFKFNRKHQLDTRLRARFLLRQFSQLLVLQVRSSSNIVHCFRTPSALRSHRDVRNRATEQSFAVSHKVSWSHGLLVRGCMLWAEVINIPHSESKVCGTADSEQGFYEQNMFSHEWWKDCCPPKHLQLM